MNFAGAPPTIEYGGKSLVNTLPIATIVPSEIILPGVNNEFIPTQQSLPIIVCLSGS